MQLDDYTLPRAGCPGCESTQLVIDVGLDGTPDSKATATCANCCRPLQWGEEWV